MKKNRYIYIVFLFLFSFNLDAQQTIEPLKVNIETKIDSLGNAHVNMSMTLNAAQWESFKANVGNDPQILKRNIERKAPSYYLDNFNYKEDAMNRKYNLTFDALGFCTINQNGLWQINGDEKNADITKLSDNIYMVTSDYNDGGSLEQDVEKITLPANASEIKQDKDAFGKPIFTYSLNPGGGMHGKLLFLIGGILLLAAGAVIFFITSKSK